ncbi:piggyBac transposable element-derived protein 3-like [Siniperca chuatsi]|uniref:piggyBac transposable element-derived protein 3-like n=1 Tax=Siniperca chuatsi TaxID=119488 RepID=UPI001CE1E160|nr:piggyBac transposable element-derived protein 3-like [Siniperca chuatsi]XP_044023762.1 piggyBac transposable element-derived protein 3-like [Siniperca chuatsi]XP_044023763.1 piggyBac transposable element-derived protein 3-like [Siniperca chuatsi]
MEKQLKVDSKQDLDEKASESTQEAVERIMQPANSKQDSDEKASKTTQEAVEGIMQPANSKQDSDESASETTQEAVERIMQPANSKQDSDESASETTQEAVERIMQPANSKQDSDEKASETAQEVVEGIMQPANSKQDSDESASETEDDSNTDDDVEFTLVADESDDSDDSDSHDDSNLSGEDMEEAMDPSDHKWKSKNGQIVWSPTHTEMLRYIPVPCVNPGPTRYAISRISTLKSCFDLFLTEEIITCVLDMTNLQGRRSIKDWKDIDATDLQAYIGLLILAGVHKSRNESTCSLWNDYTGRAIFRATMSHGTFSLINSTVRFEDKRTRSASRKQDRLAAFRTIWEKWSHRLPLLFNTGKDVCVDEQLVPFRGRCGFRQYIPSKPAKYGIKIWVTCDVATSYAWKMQIYTGKSAGSAPEVNQGKRVVLDMTEGLKGRTVTCDNFFTTYALAEELLKRKIALVGTIRKNKPELPQQLLDIRQRQPRSSLFAFTKTHTVVSYVPRRGKNVTLLSTKHREPAVSAEEHQKPKIITDYNSCKGGVDNLDKCVGAYSCRRKTCRWPLVLFYNMLDVSVYNAFVLWSAVDPFWNQKKTFKRRLFIEELGKMLVSPQMLRRQRLPRTPAAATMVVDLRKAGDNPMESREPDSTSNKRRKLCEFCTGKKKRIATTCKKCDKYICKDHTSSYCSCCCT